ncbi:hypothetical protein QIA23_05650 (plasmid) [Borreliella lanei]|uniref:hypothetical protein n=1 Tax=Borreliella lanei TaxID=373540 RepID=UPI003AF126EF
MSKAFDEIYCQSCSKAIKKDAKICVACGTKNKQNKKFYYELIAFLLCLVFGYLRFHNFYAGNKTKISLSCLFISIVSFLLTVLLYKKQD